MKLRYCVRAAPHTSHPKAAPASRTFSPNVGRIDGRATAACTVLTPADQFARVVPRTYRWGIPWRSIR